jgi:hypothetical protein
MNRISILILLFLFFQTLPGQAQEPRVVMHDADSLLKVIIAASAREATDCGQAGSILFADPSAISKINSQNISEACYREITGNFSAKYGYFTRNTPLTEVPLPLKITGMRQLLRNDTLRDQYLYRNLQTIPGQESTIEFVVKNDLRAFFEVSSATWAEGYVATLIGKQRLRIDLVYQEEWIPDPGLPADEKESDIFLVVEESPEFPGGTGAMKDWMKTNITAAGLTPSRHVFVNFVVETEGHLTGFRVIRGDKPETDSAIVRALRSMPAWKPGKQDGKAVRVRHLMKVEGRNSND